MQSNAVKSCAVAAMLFGGTLGASSTAEAGLTFTNEGVNPTVNYAYNLTTFDTAFNQSHAALSSSVGGLNVVWSATTGSGFSTTITPSGSFDYDVTTTRTFTVTGSQEVSFSWSGNYSLAFAIVNGPGLFTPVSGLGAGWGTTPSGFAVTNAASGSVTVTLAAGNYWIASGLGQSAGTGASFFNFVVPAPGAIALLGAAGVVGSRRRRG
jgi:hypothetical protein